MPGIVHHRGRRPCHFPGRSNRGGIAGGPAAAVLQSRLPFSEIALARTLCVCGVENRLDALSGIKDMLLATGLPGIETSLRCGSLKAAPRYNSGIRDETGLRPSACLARSRGSTRIGDPAWHRQVRLHIALGPEER